MFAESVAPPAPVFRNAPVPLIPETVMRDAAGSAFSVTAKPAFARFVEGLSVPCAPLSAEKVCACEQMIGSEHVEEPVAKSNVTPSFSVTAAPVIV